VHRTSWVLTGLSLSSIAFASPPTVDLEPVIVTVRKLSEPVSTIPASTSIVDAYAIESRGLTSAYSFANALANVSFQPTFGRTADRPAIRGQTNTVGERAVGSFVDGVYVPGGIASIGMAALQRIEVVRGPQTAMFGRGTLAGAINYVTRLPGAEPEFRAAFDVGTERLHDANLYAAAPLGRSDLRASIAVRHYATAGWYRNTGLDGGRAGAESSRAAMLALVHEPSVDARETLRVAWSEDDDGIWPAHTFVLRNCFVGAAGPVAAGGYWCGRARAIRVDGVQTDFNPRGLVQPGLRKQARSVSLEISRQVAGTEYVALGAASDERSAWAYDDARQNAQDGAYVYTGSTPGGLQLFDRRWRARSLELRASRQGAPLRWLAGVYLYDERRDTASGAGTIVGSAVAPPPGAPSLSTRDVAVFGRVEFAWRRDWTVALEGRHTRERLAVSQFADSGATFASTTPRVSVSWRPDERIGAYLSYARGTRPGDRNLALYGAAVPPTERARLEAFAKAGEEYADTLETGVRSNPTSHLDLQATAFSTDWRRQQVATPFQYRDALGRPATITLVTTGGRTRINGLELAARWHPGRTQIDVTYGLAAGNVVRGCDPIEGALTGACSVAGRRPPLAPRHTAATALEHELASGRMGRIVAGLQYTFQGTRFDAVGNRLSTGASHRFDLSLACSSGPWRLAAWVRNAGNDRAPTSITAVVDLDAGLPARRAFLVRYPPGRSAGLSLAYTR
jgi:iron complex outermembrane receptor protein